MKEYPVFQVIGFKDTGKTSFLSELISYGAELGEKVAVIKHHSHSEPLEAMHEDTDSYKLKNAGSYLTGVASPYQVQLEMDTESEMPLKQIIKFYGVLAPDLILVEGFKTEDYPKAVIIKRKEDLCLLDCSHIEFVMTWDEELTSHLNIPVYPIHKWKTYIEDIYQVVKGVRSL